MNIDVRPGAQPFSMNTLYCATKAEKIMTRQMLDQIAKTTSSLPIKTWAESTRVIEVLESSVLEMLPSHSTKEMLDAINTWADRNEVDVLNASVIPNRPDGEPIGFSKGSMAP